MTDASQQASEVSTSDENVRSFFDRCASTMGWDDLTDDVVMDIGCGFGESTHRFVERFPDVKQVVGIDNQSMSLVAAHEFNCHPNVEFHRADMRHQAELETWNGAITKAISIYCFQQLRDQKLGFENLHRLLKPGGEAALLFSLRSSFFDWFKDLAQQEKWNKFLPLGKNAEIPESHYMRFDHLHYKQMVEDVGFEVILCRSFKGTITYKVDEICKDALVTSCPITAYIPEDRKAEFVEECFQLFLNHNARDKDGCPNVWFEDLHLMIKKPLTDSRPTSVHGEAS